MSWRELYPFAAHTFVTDEGLKMNYVDEAADSSVPYRGTMVMLHGNPTWSFFYRNLIQAAVKAGYRAIAPDMIGCGLSEKPQKWGYHLEQHISNVEQLLKGLDIVTQSSVLVCHDWGGAIGSGVAVRHPDWFRRFVFMNTAAFRATPAAHCPRSIWLCRLPLFGTLMIRGFNAFVKNALRWAVVKPLASEIQEGFCFPYGNWHDRIATLRFVQDIPLKEGDYSYETLKTIEQSLSLLQNKPIRLLWGEKDFCFHMGFYQRWKQFFPQAEGKSWPQAGHYLLEDCGEEIIPEILREP